MVREAEHAQHMHMSARELLNTLADIEGDVDALPRRAKTPNLSNYCTIAA